MPNRINHNLAVNSANQNIQQTHLLTKANEKHDAIQTASESTNTKLDQFSGAINNAAIGDGTVKLQTYCYGHDVANGQARALKVDANGRLECNVADIELHTGDIALSVDGLEALIGTTNTKLQSDLDFAGQPNSIGDGSNMKRTMNYGHDSAAGQQRPLKVDGDGHLQVDILSSAAPVGSATEATLAAAEVHLGNIETAVQLSDDVVTAQNAAHPSKANAVGGRYYVDNTFRDIRVDNIGKVIIDTPTGSDLDTRLATIGTNTGNIDGKITACNTGAVVVSSSALPSGAATESTLSTLNGKVTACNTGAIAGSVTANAGTNLNTSALALESGGNLATIAGTVGSSKVNVNISSDAAGLATQVTAAAIAGDTTSIDGKITACNTGAVVVSSSALPSGAATESTLSTLNGKITACNTGAVVVSSSALPSGAATESTLSTLNGKITACNTGAIAGTVTANAGTNLNTSALALESGGNLATIAGDTTSIDGKINQGYDATVASGGSGLQQVLLYGRDNSGNLDAVKVTANGDVDVEIADFVKGQTTMSASFPVTIASNQSSLTVQDTRTYGTLTTVDASLTVGGSSNADSSIVNNTDYFAVYQLQIICSDALYTSWTADVLYSIDASNFHITQLDINNGPSGPGSKLLTIVDRPTTSWKVNIQNTGGVSKNFEIKYIKA